MIASFLGIVGSDGFRYIYAKHVIRFALLDNLVEAVDETAQQPIPVHILDKSGTYPKGLTNQFYYK